MSPRDEDVVTAERSSLLAKQPSYGADASSAAEAGTFQEEEDHLDEPVSGNRLATIQHHWRSS
jgi:hypothetical protein